MVVIVESMFYKKYVLFQSTILDGSQIYFIIIESQYQMFESQYKNVQVIKSRKAKKTSIVMDSKNNYFIAKKIAIDNVQAFKEMQMLKNISHPNIVTLHDIIVQENAVYIIEEYCEEGDLAFHMLRRNKIKRSHYPQETVAKWILQILLALDYLHSNKIIHRDLRPQNIFLTAQGHIKLGSFKFSKLLQKQSGLGLAFTIIAGSNYAAPQCIKDQGYDVKADIWSLGILLQQICTLKLNNIVQNAQRIMNGKIDQLPNFYSSNLNEIYQSCLKLQPKLRPTAQQILSHPYFVMHLKKLIHRQQNPTGIRKIPIKRYKVHKQNQEKIKVNQLKNFALQKKQSKQRELLKPFEPQKQPIKYDGPYKIKISAIKTLKQNDKQIKRQFERKASIETRKDRQKLPQINPNKLRTKSRQVSKREWFNKFDQSNNGLKNQNQLGEQINSKSEVFGTPKKQLGSLESIDSPPKLLPPSMLPRPIRRKPSGPNTPEFKSKLGQLQQSKEKKNVTREATIQNNQQNEKQKQQQNADKKLFGNLLQIKPAQQQEQLSFELEEEDDVRIMPQNKKQNIKMVDTYTTKLEELKKFMAYKYSPNMETILQRTMEMDSNTFANIKL